MSGISQLLPCTDGAIRCTMRSSHTKSRNGCRECKQRHRKCDESVPICRNCAIANRPCSYRFTRPTTHHRLRTGISSSPGSASASASPSSPLSPYSTSPASPASTTDCVAPRWQPQLHNYNLKHLELLHHLDRHVFRDADSLYLPTEIQKMIMQCALGTPYLMDQVLALSAAHLSTMRPGHHLQNLYRNQATILQTRALTMFNKMGPGILEQHGCSWFLYSAVLGLQVMFETFQCDSFNDFLGQLSTYLSIHRGVRAVTHQSWSNTKHLVERIVGHHSYLGDMKLSNEERSPECSILSDLIDQSDMEEEDRDACRQAVDGLQWLFDLYLIKPSMSTRIHFTVAWPITMPARFASLLGAHRPEALAILAFYAVLLHRSRSFWVFGDSGRFLIESILVHLGNPWGKWLAWPKHQLEEAIGT